MIRKIIEKLKAAAERENSRAGSAPFEPEKVNELINRCSPEEVRSLQARVSGLVQKLQSV